MVPRKPTLLNPYRVLKYSDEFVTFEGILILFINWVLFLYRFVLLN
ncbi:transmembrane protein [Arabidopsis thaliana]|uniref:Transmembrane protein n=1 Tax=Arabidopsis thaliana TaxID=3702 RepID=B3H7H0_ARATH|nr:uncharacterized protein AT5G09711 [Arabidopsis thaliana]AED91437.1 transmembrane protein [Arabidopsis thaliana]|eukprot:NP_001119201.1 transmembrane protein [Arabidopsis thaliana]